MNALVCLLSAAILACEVVLMRAFSIAQWHHFAAMIISIALLGFGLSGTVLALWREQFLKRFHSCFALCVIAFLFTAPACAWLALQIPFSPMLIIWQPSQLLRLAAIDLLLLVPFAAGALAIGLALARAHQLGTVHRLYALNLVGSGLGAVAGLALCYFPLPVRMSEYKGLQKALAMAGTRVVQTRYHPLGRVDVVEGPALRVAPGLSVAYPGSLPPQQLIFVDGEGGSPLVRTETSDDTMAYLEWLPTAAPYQVLRTEYVSGSDARGLTSTWVITPGDVLVIGIGGGTALQQADRYESYRKRGVEIHPVVAELADQVTGERSYPGEGRAFLRTRRSSFFNLIQLGGMESSTAALTGLTSGNENYLYTVEAFHQFLNRLGKNDLLAVTLWLDSPPRSNVKLFATAVDALERLGVRQPDQQLAFIRGWATGTLLVRNSPFSREEIERLRRWADERVFDVDYFPGATEADVNRRNVMPEPTYFRVAQTILFGDRQRFYREYPFQVRPATDNRPYFFHFFRWKSAPQLWRVFGRQGVALAEWGSVVQVATLVQATLLSVVLIGLPLAVGRTSRRTAVDMLDPRGPCRAFTFVYFAAIGFGFMFLEIALLQQFMLFLGNPLYAGAVVLATFLVCAGIGSAWAGHWAHTVRTVAGIVTVLALLAAVALRPGFYWFLLVPYVGRYPFAIAVAFLAPLAVFMGMMFPLGLARTSEPLLPWAWAVNGCASVVGAALASVLAMDFGFSAVLAAAAALYALAGAVYRRLG